MEKDMRTAISEILDSQWGLHRQTDGTFCYEIFADYRDEMGTETAIKVLQSENPMDTFYDMLWEWYCDYEYELRAEIEGKVKKALTAPDGLYPDGLTDEEEELFDDLMLGMLFFSLPQEHYLKQSFPVDIMLDTGDGNYDYVLNSVYPCWCGNEKDRIDNKASIVWLAKSQGYNKTTLWKALRTDSEDELNGFLKSMLVEVRNVSSHMNTVTFLVEMTLEELIELNRLIKLQDRNGHFYDTRKNPYCGYIMLEKNTMTGLFDPWNGGGSLFEIELEKDVRLPVKYIRSALPDGGDGYSVDAVYGMCGSAWKQGGTSLIHAPKNL